MASYVDKRLKRFGITLPKPLVAVACVIFGMLVILSPTVLAWTVGLLLMIQGLLLLIDYFEQETQTTPTTASETLCCSSCGTRNPEEATYCKSCGRKLAETEHVVTAPPQEVIQ